MMYKVLVCLSLLICTSFKPPTKVSVSNGKIVTYSLFNSKFVWPRNIDVWLPDGYNNKNKYAVLYMHDGQMLFDSTTTWNKQEWKVDETIKQLQKEYKIKRCIVVAIHSIGKYRHSDYFPQKPFESLSKQLQDSLYNLNRSESEKLFNAQVQSDNYLKFIVQEVKPFIDSNYSTLKDAANTVIVGSSMGALISLYAMCEYPKIFGGAACISTHWPGVMPDGMQNPIPNAINKYLQAHLPDAATHKLYFDYGTATLDAYYKPLQIEVDKLMKHKKYTSKNWITKKFINADHSEKSWSARLHVPLQFILAKTK